MREPVRHIRPEDRVPGPETLGMIREEAVSTGQTWAGLVRTAPGAVSGWHHHGSYESAIYVLSGALRMESGPGGHRVTDAEPGDFLFIPPGVVHRESNLTDVEAHIVVVRSGSGEAVFNVDGPEHAGDVPD